MSELEIELTQIEAVALDIETTGLEPDKGDDICEIAAVRISGGEISGDFSSLVKPAVPISPEAFAVNQITEDMLAQAPLFSQILHQLLEFIGDRILVVHNAPFDLAFVQKKIAETGKPLLRNSVVDTLVIARALDGLPGQNSLGQVAQRLGVVVRGAHRALEDATVTAKVFSTYVQRLQSSGKRRLLEIPGVSASAADLVPTIARAARSPEPKPTSGVREIIEAAIRKSEALDICLGGSGAPKTTANWLMVRPIRLSPDGVLTAYCPLRGREEQYRVAQISRAALH